MYPGTEPGGSESRPFVIDDYFLTVFIRRAPEVFGIPMRPVRKDQRHRRHVTP